MSRELYIWIAFCVFAFLVGMRLKKYFSRSKEAVKNIKINKNQRSKIAKEEPRAKRKNWRNRKKTIKFFTILAMILLFGILIFMIPALVRDVQRIGDVDIVNLFLRIIIFILAIVCFLSAYLKVMRKVKE